MFHVVEEDTIILVAVRPPIFFPFSSPVLESAREVADVARPVLPLVIAKSVRLAKLVISSVAVAVPKDVSSLAVLQIVLPFAFVAIPILPLVDAIAVDLAIAPLPDIRVALEALPQAKALLDVLLPLSIVDLTVRPSEDSLPMDLIVEVLPDILRPIAEQFVPSPVAAIVLPFAFVYPTVVIDQDSKAHAFALNQSALVERILRPFNAKLLSFAKLVVVKQLRKHGVVLRLLLCFKVPLRKTIVLLLLKDFFVVVD